MPPVRALAWSAAGAGGPVRRIAAAAVLLPLAGAAAWAGGSWLTALLAAAAAVGASELALMAAKMGFRPSLATAVLWSVGLVAAFHLHAAGHPPELTIAPAAFGGGLVAIAAARAHLRDAFATAAAALCSGGLLGFAALLRSLPEGADWALAALVVIAAADVGAYTVGSLVGRRPLAPAISPAKTWEGAAAGLAAAVGAALAISAALGPSLSAPEAAGMGALLWGGALCGDLAESAAKRRAGVKDSGALIPGHGGLFDRLDSLVLSLPLCYGFARWVGA